MDLDRSGQLSLEGPLKEPSFEAADWRLPVATGGGRAAGVATGSGPGSGSGVSP